MELTENARKVLEKRYLRKEGGRTETPEEMLRRVAVSIAAVDAVYGKSEGEVKAVEEAFYRLMDECLFLPNSPTLMNAGNELQQLAACFVLPIEDDMHSIFETLKNAALVHKSGGGTGFSFSRLRPKSDVVRSTGGVASGPVSFMAVFNAATEAVKQGGTRRGANMGILRVDHPDILEFITCKQDNKEINNFNISVAITDSFMAALEGDEHYPLRNPRTGEEVGTLSAREVFGMIVRNAWANGEPGVIFIDRINADNPTPHIGAIESTNPCGEQPLLPLESCNLGSINLKKFVTDGTIDYEGLKEVVHTAVHFLDNVIDANRYPTDEIGKMTKANRKIGLGVMGWAEMLIQLGIPYDSEEALSLAGEVMGFIDRESKEASAGLARQRGVFPNFPGSVYDQPGGPEVRNATTTTIAPTGTISIIAGVTAGGIEPLFSLAFTRRVLDGEELVEVNPLFEEVARREGFSSPELMARIARTGSVQDNEEVPEKWRRLFVTALDIDPEWHVRVQAAFQEAGVDNAVSKTINAPFETTVEQVDQVFRLAYQLGCKGITFYRNGSRDEQVLNVGGATGDTKTGAMARRDGQTHPGDTAGGDDDGPAVNGPWGHIHPLDRPSRLRGITDARKTPLGTLYLTLNLWHERPFELFAQIGKAGSDVTAFTEAIARLASLAFRCGVDPDEVAEQLMGIGGSRSVGFGPNRVLSVPDAIGHFLLDYLEENPPDQLARRQASLFDTDKEPGDRPLIAKVGAAGRTSPPDNGKANGSAKARFNLCPSCGMNALAYMEGCSKCLACGFTEC